MLFSCARVRVADAKLDRTYQLNVGGNTDFLNMLNRHRLASKKISKTEAVQAMLDRPPRPENIHIGPSDYVPWQKDTKVCFIRMEGRLFGDVPMSLELRLSVEDSPNSAGVVIDAIRVAQLAREHGVGRVLLGPSAAPRPRGAPPEPPALHPPVPLAGPHAPDADPASPGFRSWSRPPGRSRWRWAGCRPSYRPPWTAATARSPGSNSK